MANDTAGPPLGIAPSLARLLPQLSEPEQAVVAIAGAIALLLLVIAAWLWFTRTKPPEQIYQAKQILTDNETEFYGRLLAALPDYTILSQVAMSALIEPVRCDPKEFMGRRAKFSQKYVDFVICEPGVLRVICIVELDDITHDEEKDAARDAMLNDAGYIVVRWHSRRKPDIHVIADTIAGLDDGPR